MTSSSAVGLVAATLHVTVDEGVDRDELLVVDSGGGGSDNLRVVVSEGVSCDELLGVDDKVSCSGKLLVTVGGEGVSGD